MGMQELGIGFGKSGRRLADVGSEMGGQREVRFVRLAALEGGVWAGGRVCGRAGGCVWL